MEESSTTEGSEGVEEQGGEAGLVLPKKEQLQQLSRDEVSTLLSVCAGELWNKSAHMH